jgi:hypothetical protein
MRSAVAVYWPWIQDLVAKQDGMKERCHAVVCTPNYVDHQENQK